MVVSGLLRSSGKKSLFTWREFCNQDCNHTWLFLDSLLHNLKALRKWKLKQFIGIWFNDLPVVCSRRILVHAFMVRSPFCGFRKCVFLFIRTLLIIVVIKRSDTVQAWPPRELKLTRWELWLCGGRACNAQLSPCTHPRNGKTFFFFLKRGKMYERD